MIHRQFPICLLLKMPRRFDPLERPRQLLSKLSIAKNFGPAAASERAAARMKHAAEALGMCEKSSGCRTGSAEDEERVILRPRVTVCQSESDPSFAPAGQTRAAARTRACVEILGLAPTSGAELASGRIGEPMPQSQQVLIDMLTREIAQLRRELSALRIAEIRATGIRRLLRPLNRLRRKRLTKELREWEAKLRAAETVPSDVTYGWIVEDLMGGCRQPRPVPRAFPR